MILWRNARSVGRPEKSLVFRNLKNAATRRKKETQDGNNLAVLFERVGGYFPPPPALVIKEKICRNQIVHFFETLEIWIADLEQSLMVSILS